MNRHTGLALGLCLLTTQAFAMLGATLDSKYTQVGTLRAIGETEGGCTATLIASDWIITAEHCRYGGDEGDPVTYTATELEFVVGQEKVILKQLVSPAANIDVLFGRLSRSLSIKPIPLSTTLNSKSSFEIVGFGTSDKHGHEGKRQRGNVQVTTTSGNAFLSIFKSKANFEKYLTVAHPGEEKMIDKLFHLGNLQKNNQVHVWDQRGRENGLFTKVPKGGWTSSCNGDSGGPLLQTDATGIKVVGVISSGFNGEVEACVRLGTLISVMGPKTIEAIKKNKIPAL